MYFVHRVPKSKSLFDKTEIRELTTNEQNCLAILCLQTKNATPWFCLDIFQASLLWRYPIV
jgi:hypothetical protein